MAFVITGANVYMGDQNAAIASKHMTTDSITLPEMKLVTSQMNGAGTVAEYDVVHPKVEKLELKIKLMGYDPQAEGMLGKRDFFTVYKNIKDEDTGVEHQLMARVNGIMVEAVNGEAKAGEHGEGDYVITSIRHYSKTFANKLVHKFNHNPPQLVISGKNFLDSWSKNLAIPA